MASSSSSTEHSVLIALRELDSLEQQRRDELAARERADLAAQAAAQAEIEARAHVEQAARARAIAEAEAAAEAQRARRAHALHLRNLEIEADLQRERDARLLRVQAEIDGRVRSHSRRETAGQRVVGVVLLAVLGLAGAVGAMLLTRPQASVVERAVASASELRRAADLKEYAAAVAAIEQDLGRLRSDTERQEAVIDAAAALHAMMPAQPEPSRPVARPGKPRPHAPPDAGKQPTSGKIKICDFDDPLAEDC